MSLWSILRIGGLLISAKFARTFIEKFGAKWAVHSVYSDKFGSTEKLAQLFAEE